MPRHREQPGRLATGLLSAGGLGRSPWAPGTVASIATAALVYLVTLPGSSSQPSDALHACAALVVAGSLASLFWGGLPTKADGKGDPGWVVADEVAGQALASAGAVLAGGVAAHVLALVLFRVFDILKPPPVKQAEALDGGLGVLADDIVAGLIAAGLTLAVGATGLLDHLA